MNKMKGPSMIKLLTPICAAFILSGCIVHVGDAAAKADQHKKQHLTLNAAGLATLQADLGAGSLSITGSDNIDKIHVEADIYTFEDSDYTLTLDSTSNKARLVAQSDSRNGNVWVIGNQSPRINLSITMPNDLLLDIEDRSGDIRIDGMTNHIEINDGSGDINIDGGTNITIEDGSGDIHIDGGQAINIEDGSGDLHLANALGDIDIDDGSGDLTLKNTHGEIYVKDGSGSLKIKHAKGNITVDDGSGDLSVAHAQQNLTIEDHSGSIFVKQISGDVVIEDDAGDIDVNGAGSLHIKDAGPGDVNFSNITGKVSGDLKQ